MNFDRLFDYDAWANREEAQHLRSLAKPPEKAIKILAHIIGAQWLFLGRLRRDPKPATVWPDLTRDQIAADIEKLAAAWPAEFGRTDVVEVVLAAGPAPDSSSA